MIQSFQRPTWRCAKSSQPLGELELARQDEQAEEDDEPPGSGGGDHDEAGDVTTPPTTPTAVRQTRWVTRLLRSRARQAQRSSPASSVALSSE